MVIIDIRTTIYSPGLYARIIWQQLFKLSNAKDFNNLDSFLCDLKTMENMILGGMRKFYWQYNPSGYTNLTQYYIDNGFQIIIQEDTIEII